MDMPNIIEERNENLTLVSLHEYPEYREECKYILKKEWFHCDTFWYDHFDSSNDNLPTSLAFIDKKCEKVEVIGHSRLKCVPDNSETVWVEAVIIHNGYRGKGYGSILMKKIEEYVDLLGFSLIALSTVGQENFYLKLEYKFMKPIGGYGGGNAVAFKQQNNCTNSVKENSNVKNCLSSDNCNNYQNEKCLTSDSRYCSNFNSKNNHDSSKGNNTSISPSLKPSLSTNGTTESGISTSQYPLSTNSTTASNILSPPLIGKFKISDIQTDGIITIHYFVKNMLLNESVLYKSVKSKKRSWKRYLNRWKKCIKTARLRNEINLIDILPFCIIILGLGFFNIFIQIESDDRMQIEKLDF